MKQQRDAMNHEYRIGGASVGRIRREVSAEGVALEHLEKDEKLLWSGCPRPFAASAARSRNSAIPGMVVCGFTGGLIWLVFYGDDYGVQKHQPDLLIYGVLGLFFVIGWLLIMWQFYCWRKARKTVYAVTDRRVLEIIDHGGDDVAKVIDLAPMLVHVEVIGDPAAWHGTVSLGRADNGVKVNGKPLDIGLFAIERPQDVRDIIRKQEYAKLSVPRL